MPRAPRAREASGSKPDPTSKETAVSPLRAKQERGGPHGSLERRPHRKTAIFGWLAFVIVLVRHRRDRRHARRSTRTTPTSAKPARPITSSVTPGSTIDEQMEYVLVQSKSQTVADPTFRAAVKDAISTLEGFPQVGKLRSPLAAGNEGQVASDGHSALIQFSPKGDLRRGCRLHRHDHPAVGREAAEASIPSSPSSRPVRFRPVRR